MRSKVRQTGTRALKSIGKKKKPPKLPVKVAPRKAPIVEDTIIDVIDEPVQGVVRVTEYEIIRRVTPKPGADPKTEQ